MSSDASSYQGATKMFWLHSCPFSPFVYRWTWQICTAVDSGKRFKESLGSISASIKRQTSALVPENFPRWCQGRKANVWAAISHARNKLPVFARKGGMQKTVRASFVPKWSAIIADIRHQIDFNSWCDMRNGPEHMLREAIGRERRSRLKQNTTYE